MSRDTTVDEAFIDFYAGLNPARIIGTDNPMVTHDYYDLSQLKAAFEAGKSSRSEMPATEDIGARLRAKGYADVPLDRQPIHLRQLIASETTPSKAEINAEIHWAAWQTGGGMDAEDVLNLIATEFQWKLPK